MALPLSSGFPHLSQKVKLRKPHLMDSKGVSPTIHTSLSGKTTFEVRTFAITETKTTVTVLWQDGTEGEHLSTDLIPHITDAYECWLVPPLCGHEVNR